MSITFSNFVSNDTQKSTPLTLNPAATALDVLIAAAVTDTSSAVTFTWPTSFDQLANQLTTADGQTLGVARKKSASGSEGSLNITPSADALLGFIARFSGVDNTTPEDIAVNVKNNNSATASPWTIDSDSLTPITSGAKIVAIMASDDTTGGNDVHSFSTVSGSTGAWTKHIDICDTGFSSFRNLAMASADWTSGSVTVRGTGTLAAHSAGRSMVVIVLRPAGGGGAANIKRPVPTMTGGMCELSGGTV